MTLAGGPVLRAIECDDVEFDALAQTILTRGLTLRFRAKGISMHPFVRDRDVLFVKAVPYNEMQIGDLVLFRKGETKMVVHRVLKRMESKGKESFLIKGDRTNHHDGIVPFHKVLGKVIARDRDGEVVDLTDPGWRILGRVIAGVSPFHRFLPSVRRLGDLTISIGRDKNQRQFRSLAYFDKR